MDDVVTIRSNFYYIAQAEIAPYECGSYGAADYGNCPQTATPTTPETPTPETTTPTTPSTPTPSPETGTGTQQPSVTPPAPSFNIGTLAWWIVPTVVVLVALVWAFIVLRRRFL